MNFPKEIQNIIDSYLYSYHKDALDYQRQFRVKLYNQSKKGRIMMDNDFFFYQRLVNGAFLFSFYCKHCDEIMFIGLFNKDDAQRIVVSSTRIETNWINGFQCVFCQKIYV